jgi:hypothetical protein
MSGASSTRLSAPRPRPEQRHVHSDGRERLLTCVASAGECSGWHAGAFLARLAHLTSLNHAVSALRLTPLAPSGDSNHPANRHFTQLGAHTGARTPGAQTTQMSRNEGPGVSCRRRTGVVAARDLRHRRISLLHRQGRTWAEIGALVGQRSLKVTSDTYTHVLVDSSDSTARRCSRDRSRGPSGYLEVLAQLAIPKLALWEPPYVPEGGPRPPADAAATFATLVEEHRRGEAVEFFMAEVVGPPPEFVAGAAHNRSGPGRKRWRTRSPTTQRSWATTGCRRSASRVSRRRRWCWTVARARLGWA